ncbi:hypothetical protein [Bacteroides thetaiotaomicron]|jgi:hypothetical protein|uniref:hypothetical protein n=1 Tax=Bacteroides thetaiotaomicron TaxID=818 RepID=UPI0006D54AB0|nr:hypothetical protein [Bacteroides thetaiotaomicron]
MKVKVVSIFRDKYTHKLYNPGEVIEIVDESRVKDLASRNLAECIETPEEKKEVKISLFEQEFEKKALVEVLKAVGVQASGNMKEGTLLAKIAELDEESTAKLKGALGIE